MPEWQCTYRLQINAGFDFAALAGLAPYLHELGVSHAYLSPILRAAPGSSHGYDVADATLVNPEWGGEEGYLRASRALREHGIGQLLDIVPNHMSVATPANSWWWDVLQHGVESEFFHFFDFGWDPDRRDFRPLRLPVLEDRYVRVLNAGKIRVVRTEEDLRVRYGAADFPVRESSVPWLVRTVAEGAGLDQLGRLANAFEGVNSRRFWAMFNATLAEHDGLTARFDAALERLNQDPTLLHTFLDQQLYRLAYWRTANESWVYRRFFDINTLVGLRIEKEDVFLVRHRTEIRLARSGLIDGLRIDHIDGLRHPLRYLEALRRELPDKQIWVEKILGLEESLPTSWPVAGTTGYDYLALLNDLYVQPRGEEQLTTLYHHVTGNTSDYDSVLTAAKAEMLKELFGGEFNDLVDLVFLAGEARPEGRDWSRHAVESALAAYIVALPVYRTYVETGALTPEDAQRIDASIAIAAARHPDAGEDLYAYLRALLKLEVGGELAREFVLRMQQLTGPVMAKGAEDTAFYRYSRLLSLNEVGGSPSRFGTTVEDWHRFCDEVARSRPRTMVATSTHDTKRGEDARQRLNVLSELPEQWTALVNDLAAVDVGAEPPDAATRYFAYQTFVAAWPLDAERAVEYLRKAMREAKTETSWTTPNERYEAIVEQWVRAALGCSPFRERIAAFVAVIDPFARRNSLSQTVLKLTAPGVPDIYRGTEVFSHSLVDPDNRRPVDFARLQGLLQRASARSFDPTWIDEEPDLAKLWLSRRTLALRREHPEAFSETGSYRPLPVASLRAIAYQRGEDIIVIAARWFTEGPPNFALDLPPGRWENVYTLQEHTGSVGSASLLGGLPAALLVRR